METCNNCPFPKRCIPANRCIAYKVDATPVVLPEPKPVPVKTSFGIGMNGKAKKAKKK